MANMASYGGNGLHRPATGITWYRAVKFVNYLNASRGSQVAYNVDANAGTSACLEGSYRWTGVNPTDGLASFGLCVASVSEPGTIGLMVVGLACVLAKRMGCRR